MPMKALCILMLLPWTAAASPRLVPFPKEVEPRPGAFALARALVLEAEPALAPLLGQRIAEELALARLSPPSVRAVEGGGHVVRLHAGKPGDGPPVSFRAGRAEEDYFLSVQPEAVTIAAPGPAGLLHGVETLRQLLRANREGDSLPCLSIRDWPSIRWRAFQDDLTRGPSTRLDQLEMEVSLGAYFKLNVFTYYMEYQYAFANHPAIGPAAGSLTPAELKALVDHARLANVDVLGNQQSFAHMEHVLARPEYAALGENGFVLSPVKEETYRFLDDLYSEEIPLLPFEFFNVCCDETFGLGEGPSKPLAERIGPGGVYVRHIQRVHDIVKGKYGKRMMMWGDIILNHRDKLAEVPKDVVLLTWGYHPGSSFEDQIVPFASSGFEFFVCPGVSCWSRVLPHFSDAVTNVRNFVRDGAKHGAIGVLNTAWDDDGESFNAPNWHGYAWGAECSWNASATSVEDFNRRLGAVLFGEKGDHFGRAIELLSHPALCGMMNQRFWDFERKPAWIASLAAAREPREKALRVAREAIEHLEACRREAVANAGLLDYFIFGARRMELVNRREIDGLEAAAAYREAFDAAVAEPSGAARLVEKASDAIRRTRDAHEALGRRFEELWLRENKPYALDWTMKRYRECVERYGVQLERLDAARRDAAAGRPLAAPRDVGLELVILEGRRPALLRRSTAPLRPGAPWLEPAATRRMGLTVKAGTVERIDLPIEVEVALPADLLSEPLRAFAALDGAEPREVLAQLDPTGAEGRAWLAVVVPGPVGAGRSAAVDVYFGLPSPAPRLPQSVSSSDGPGGAKWIENDRVRLLLAPEGGHVCRWELKALGGRDVTMPGDGGWAGFADLGGARREARNDLVRTAAGPAIVRLECRDPDGLVKTISVAGGASSMEVTLSEPVPWYWEYDDPANFSAAGASPGQYLFSNGAAGAVGKEGDGPASQAKAEGARWGVKFAPGGLALGLVTPEVSARHVVGPGGSWGGVGIESSPPAPHFVTFAGLLEGVEPGDAQGAAALGAAAKGAARLMERLRSTLDFSNPPEVTVHGLEAR